MLADEEELPRGTRGPTSPWISTARRFTHRREKRRIPRVFRKRGGIFCTRRFCTPGGKRAEVKLKSVSLLPERLMKRIYENRGLLLNRTTS